MKILILGHYEIASNYAISLVVNALSEHDVSIRLSGKGDAFEGQETGFSYLAKYEQELCDALNAGKDPLGLGCDSFDVLAAKTGGPIEVLSRPNSQQSLAMLNELKPDLIISIRYRKILKESAIAIPKFGIINLHSGLLPHYRGAMATFWAMLNGDKQIGSTVHYISDGTIDTGRIIARSLVTCDYQASYLENVLNVYPSGCQNIAEAVDQIHQNGFAAVREPQAKGNYYSFPELEHLSEFRQKSYRLC